jgi:WD40 repeat protein
VGDNHDGKIYTCAISPDGKLTAAGGYTGSHSAGMSVYIFDRTSGKIISRISGLPEVIHHLTFSRNGRYLAATLGGSKGIRVWETNTWSLRFQDPAYGDSSHWADFDPNGRLLTTSYDGLVRLYSGDFNLLTSIKPPGGEKTILRRVFTGRQ